MKKKEQYGMYLDLLKRIKAIETELLVKKSTEKTENPFPEWMNLSKDFPQVKLSNTDWNVIKEYDISPELVYYEDGTKFLRNIFDETKEESLFFNEGIILNRRYFNYKNKPTMKKVFIDDFKLIRPGDIVRFSNDVNFIGEFYGTNQGWVIVEQIKDNEILAYTFLKIGIFTGRFPFVYHFSEFKYCQIALPNERAEINDACHNISEVNKRLR